MTFLMTATPISMHLMEKISLSKTGFVIQLHIAAMFLPSLVTGNLIQWFGHSNIMYMGVLLFLVTIITSLFEQNFINYMIALIFLGLGWNFLFVGGSDVIAKSSNPKEKPIVQGVTDFIIFGSVALSSFLGGNFLASIGWHMMLYLSLIPISILSFYIIFLWFLKLNEAKIEI